jgi:hypothetical protein
VSETGATVRYPFHVSRSRRGARIVLKKGPAPTPPPRSRVPRISRLVALALKIEKLIDANEIADMADAARLGHVTRARMTQIMNLLLLAPDVLEELLFLPSVERGYDPITLREFGYVLQTPVWTEQRARWVEICPRTA